MAISAGRCAYMNCQLSRRNYPSVHFYKFPVKYPEKCQKWITYSGNKNLLNLPKDKLSDKLLCEMHFEEESFINRTRHRLVHDATPIPFDSVPPNTTDTSVHTVTLATSDTFTQTLNVTPNVVLNSCPSTSKNVHNFRNDEDDNNLSVKTPVPKQYRGKRKLESDNNTSSDESDVSKKIYLDTTMTKDWSRQAIISLIDLYKENSVPYDYKHPDYHSRNSRKEALDMISRELSLGLRPSTTPDDVKTKLANLRTVFTAEQHKIATYEKNNHTDNETYKPTLWWYDRMMFLKDFIVPRKLSINESPSSSSGNNVSVKEEVFEIGENDIQCELLPSNTLEEMDESNDSRIPQHQRRNEKNTEQIFGDFVSNSMVQITDLQTRSKLKNQIMKAISEAQTEDDQNFGNYVTSSLWKIKSTNIKANAKSQITQILCDAQMEDMRN